MGWMIALWACGYRGLQAVMAHNAVHAVMFLVATFVAASVGMVMLGMEYVGLVLIVIYGGAVLILFLFVVMMVQLKAGPAVPASWWLAFTWVEVLLGLPCLIGGTWMLSPSDELNGLSVVEGVDRIGATSQIAVLFYEEYWHLYLVAGIVLLVALMGAMSLTRREEA